MTTIANDKPKRILILGGGGFIGSSIADYWLKEGHFVRIFERPRILPYRKFLKSETVEWMTGDFSSEHDMGVALEGMDIVVHLISTTLPKGSNDDTVYDVQSNVIPTLQLLNLMVHQNIGKIIFISSGGTVYGLPKYIPIDEKHPTVPLVSYGITKLMIEKYLMLYERMFGIRATILRVANPFGERQRIETAQGAVGVFIHRALQRQPIEIWGDGSVRRDYIHISDLPTAFDRALHYEGSHRIFNIGSGRGTSLNELVSMIQDNLGCALDVHYLPGRPFDVPINVLCNDLAMRELNWSPTVSMELGINLTIKSLKSTADTDSH